MNIAQTISIWALPVLFALTFHELAHAWLADRLGDPTARMLGHVTANPLKHVDPVGTVIVPLVLLSLGGFVFGWARPAPVNTRNLRSPRRDMALIAAAGPLSNLLMALLWALIMKIGLLLYHDLNWVGAPLSYMGQAGIAINVILFILNMLPLPPLDGGRVLSGVLPSQYADMLERVEPYGFFILIGLLVTGVLGIVLTPLYHGVSGVIGFVFGLPVGTQ